MALLAVPGATAHPSASEVEGAAVFADRNNRFLSQAEQASNDITPRQSSVLPGGIRQDGTERLVIDHTA